MAISVNNNQNLNVQPVQFNQPAETLRTNPNQTNDIKNPVSNQSLSDGYASKTLVTPVQRIAYSTDAPSVAALTRDVQNLAKSSGVTLKKEQIDDIKNLDPVERKMYSDVIGSLKALKDGRISPATYMTNVVSRAAQLGISHPIRNVPNGEQVRMLRLMGMAFSDPKGGAKLELSRNLAGSSPHLAGSALEQINHKVSEYRNDTRNGQFNPKITDVDSNSTVTHHFRELMWVGAVNGQAVGNLATEKVDSFSENPGDVRNGYFGSMIGRSLYLGKISNAEASGLIAWAYKTHPGTQPPWGDKPENYKIEDWMKAYRNR
jgi:hypothetical protein